MKPVLFYSRCWSNYSRIWNLISFLRRQGVPVYCVFGELSSQLLDGVIRRCGHVFMWNGEDDVHVPLKASCRAHRIDYTVIEVGFFPQKKFFVLDSGGINATSSLMDDELSWVDDTHFQKLEQLTAEYLDGRTYSGKDKYILVPLQLEEDTNITKHSPYKRMQDFIAAVEHEFPNEHILFKIHPKDRNRNYRVAAGNELVTDGNILDLAVDAKLVCGINSTCLLETTMMGVPTVAVGNGYLRRHKGNERRLLAALCDYQCPVDGTDFTYWLRRYTRFYDGQAPRPLGLRQQIAFRMLMACVRLDQLRSIGRTLIRKAYRCWCRAVRRSSVPAAVSSASTRRIRPLGLCETLSSQQRELSQAALDVGTQAEFSISSTSSTKAA